MHMDITTFGRQNVILNGSALQWPSQVAQRLFYLLLAHPGGLSRSVLTEWLGITDSHFRVTQYRLRQALSDQGATVECGGRYALAPAYYVNVDYRLFEDALRQARHAEGRERRLQLLYQALNLYQGDFLPAVADDWAEEARSGLRAAYVQARLDAAALHCGGIECQSGIRNLASGLATDPLAGEQLHRSLMTCLCTLNRSDDAVSHYRRFLDFIQREVGDTPTRETLHLADQIRNDQPHAAQQIGSPLPCPRRLLYGGSSVEKSTYALDLAPLEAELQRGKQMLSLLRKLRSARDCLTVARHVQGFLSASSGPVFVWLVPAGSSPHPAHHSLQELDSSGWPTPVVSALRAAFDAAQSDMETAGLPGFVGAGFAEASSLEAGFVEASPVQVRTHLIGNHHQPPRGTLYVARPDGAPLATPGDEELLARVVDALDTVLSQASWAHR